MKWPWKRSADWRRVAGEGGNKALGIGPNDTTLIFGLWEHGEEITDLIVEFHMESHDGRDHYVYVVDTGNGLRTMESHSKEPVE